MKRKFIKAAVLSVSLSAITLPSYGLNLFGIFKKENSMNAMLEHVPADSLLVFAGNTNKSLEDEFAQWWKNSGIATTPDLYEGLFDQFDLSPELQLFAWLFNDYNRVYSEDITTLNKYYGFKDDGASLLYTDGLFPVFRIALDDEKAFPTVLAKAAEENEYELTQSTLGDSSIYTFAIAEDESLQLYLGMVIHNKSLTVSFFTDHDNEQAKLERFALVDIDGSIAKERWKQDGNTYSYDEYLRGYIDFLSIAQAFYNPEHKAYKQFAAIADENMKKEFDDTFTSECRADVIGLISETPRVVLGSMNQAFEEGQVDVDFGVTLELKNQEVKDNLAKLRGFIPSYLTENSDLGFGLGLGVDVNQLAPVATALWTTFTSKEFSCEALQELQAEVEGMNPAVIGMGTAMMQGMSGASVGLFDFDINEENIMASSIDAIISIAAKQPQVLASMATQFVPFLNGIVIPEDGTPVSLKSDMIPMDIYAMNKGEHLVLYSGDTAANVAKGLVEEQVTSNGLASVTIDTKKLGEKLFATMTDGHFAKNSGDCTDMYIAGLYLNSIPFSLSVNSDFSENGYEDIYALSMDMSKMANLDYSTEGMFDLEYLDYDCNWTSVGTENLKADQSGEYFEMDDTGSCRTYEGKYQWTRIGMLLKQIDSEYQNRDDCDSEWAETEAEDFSCQILTQDQQGFYCLYSDSEENTLYRYKRQ